MFYKKEKIGVNIWIPPDYKFFNTFAIFSFYDNFNKFYADPILKEISDKASIIIIENGHVPDLEIFKEITHTIKFVALFSESENRYQKPYTGGFELICKLAKENNPDFEFKPAFSVMISYDIGIKNKSYIDRAFSNNINIKSITTPDIFFKKSSDILEWNYPYYVLTKKEKDKLFKTTDNYQEINLMEYIFHECCNVIIIIGPPCSGKSILSKRLMSALKNVKIFDKTIPDITIDKNNMDNFRQDIIIMTESPTLYEKNNLIGWLISNNGPNVNCLWIEIAVHRKIVEFLRHLQVQLNSNITKRTYADIKNYYIKYENCSTIPSFITRISFPLILKNIQELTFIF